ncbi:MAG: thiosulfate reductase cytochrome B subunit [Acidobacteria bacterium]|nr:thiosulfate reductase cytochrome B subunit [Acidobacteriota bacterium]
MSERIYLYSLWVRVWHWGNALLFLLLIVSGFSLHFAGPESVLLRFESAVALHNAAGWLLIVSYVGFVAGNAFSSNGRHYLPRWKTLIPGLMKQAGFYLSGIFRGAPHPFHPSEEQKFNPLQRLTYLGVMYLLMPLLLLSGLALLFPDWIPEWLLGAGSVWPIAIGHALLGFVLTVFMIGHIYLATTGPTVFQNFRDMLTGWHHAPAPIMEEEAASNETTS